MSYWKYRKERLQEWLDDVIEWWDGNSLRVLAFLPIVFLFAGAMFIGFDLWIGLTLMEIAGIIFSIFLGFIFIATELDNYREWKEAQLNRNKESRDDANER